jgi:malate dehydrogenase (oxaloacetate-decarboxylating)(NADP+)
VRYKDKTLIPGQGNNLYIFPAVGLAIYATRARRVTDEMFIAAAQSVADQVTGDEIRSGLLYPPQSNILQTEVATALRVAEVIFDRDLAGVKRPKNLQAFLESQLYKPEYSSPAAAK